MEAERAAAFSRASAEPSADNIVCIQMLQPRRYAPLENVTEAATWDQRSSNGVLVPPGDYLVTAHVGQHMSDAGGVLDCDANLGKSAAFTIR